VVGLGLVIGMARFTLAAFVTRPLCMGAVAASAVVAGATQVVPVMEAAALSTIDEPR
jgi:hypothetical protein